MPVLLRNHGHILIAGATIIPAEEGRAQVPPLFYKLYPESRVLLLLSLIASSSHIRASDDMLVLTTIPAATLKISLWFSLCKGS